MNHDNLYETLLREVRRIQKERGIRKNVEKLTPSELLDYYDRLTQEVTQ